MTRSILHIASLSSISSKFSQDEYCRINRVNTVKLTDQYSISPLYHLFPLNFHKMNTVKLQDEYYKIDGEYSKINRSILHIASLSSISSRFSQDAKMLDPLLHTMKQQI